MRSKSCRWRHDKKTKNVSQSQPVRLLYLLLYLAFLFLINRLAFDQWLPLTTSKGLWFYAGAAAMVLGSLLATPFFTSPANAISYLVAALTAILAFDVPSTTLYDMLPRQCVIFFCFATVQGEHHSPAQGQDNSPTPCGSKRF